MKKYNHLTHGPEIVSHRLRFDDWEMDTIVCPHGKWGVVTRVERLAEKLLMVY